MPRTILVKQSFALLLSRVMAGREDGMLLGDATMGEGGKAGEAKPDAEPKQPAKSERQTPLMRQREVMVRARATLYSRAPHLH